MKNFLIILFLATSIFANAQNRQEGKKVQISGKILDKVTKKPLDYATITLVNARKPSDVNGGLTNEKGEFDFEINAGQYNIKIDYISYKSFEIKQKQILENLILATFCLKSMPHNLPRFKFE